METQNKNLLLSPIATIYQAMKRIDSNRMGIVLVVAKENRLLGTITDGDIRRYILANRNLDDSVTKVMCQNPVAASPNDSEEDLKNLMALHKIRHMPIVDKRGKFVRLCEMRELIKKRTISPAAVIMAGGEGRRLRPLTEKIPKPMVKVGNIPLLENIIRNLYQSEIRQIYISINYKGKVIENYFKDGMDFNVNIKYLYEKSKLGTAGALSMLPLVSDKPFLVINADVLTETNFSSLYDYHLQHRCVMTVASIEYLFQVPYGVLKLATHYVLGIDEKPQIRFHCNAGIYVLNPEVIRLIPKGIKYDMNQLLDELVHNGLPIATFPIHEYWLDIGQSKDLKKAQKKFNLKYNDKEG